VLIYQTADLAADRVAGRIVSQVSNKPDSVLGLATGGTMVPVYQRMVSAHQGGQVRFADACSFNLDEYVGLAAEHPCSYHAFMQQHLFAETDFDAANIFLPDGAAPDPAVESNIYEALIQSTGPIDLQLLGIGANGHIGFNEPNSSLRSRTRITTLTAATRAANQRFFKDGSEPPMQAITVGIQTILEAREILLLAIGPQKRAAVVAMVEGPVAAISPASALQLHGNVTVVLDADAAAGLAQRPGP